jgi:hypothetical protein
VGIDDTSAWYDEDDVGGGKEGDRDDGTTDGGGKYDDGWTDDGKSGCKEDDDDAGDAGSQGSLQEEEADEDEFVSGCACAVSRMRVEGCSFVCVGIAPVRSPPPWRTDPC